MFRYQYEVSFGHADKSVIRTQPQAPKTVVKDCENRVVCQAMLRRVTREFSPVHSEEPFSIRAKPERAVRVARDRVDDIARHSVDHPKLIILPPGQSATVRPDPEDIVGILVQRCDEFIGQAILCREGGESGSVEPAQEAARTRP